MAEDKSYWTKFVHKAETFLNKSVDGVAQGLAWATNEVNGTNASMRESEEQIKENRQKLHTKVDEADRKVFAQNQGELQDLGGGDKHTHKQNTDLAQNQEKQKGTNHQNQKHVAKAGGEHGKDVAHYDGKAIHLTQGEGLALALQEIGIKNPNLVAHKLLTEAHIDERHVPKEFLVSKEMIGKLPTQALAALEQQGKGGHSVG